jgi:hypothetical protein
MKRTIIIITFIIVASISAFGQTPDKKSDKTSKAKEQVTALAVELANALVKGDTAALERILSVDCGTIGPGGLPLNREMVIRYFKVNENNASVPKLVAIDLGESSIRIYGDTAVMEVASVVKWRTPDNETGKKTYMATLVAVRKNGNWQFVATHYSEFESQISPSK